MNVLLDTGILLALAFPKDANHNAAKYVMRALHSGRIVPAPVLPELFYMVTERVSYSSAMKLFNTLQSAAFQIEALTSTDMTRMSQIMNEYQDNGFDFVDTAVMALAERLNITTVYTLDQRHFLAFRPVHCEHLILLP